MAIAGNGSFLKGLRGSAVNLTFKGFHDETVVQGKRAKGTFTPSEKTIQAQSVAAQLSAIYRLIRAVVLRGYTSKASNQSQYNAWYSENYANGFDLSSPPDAVFEPTTFSTAKGVMTQTPVSSVTADVSDGTVITTYPTTVSDASQSTFDEAIIVIHNRTQDKWINSAAGAAGRASGTLSVGVPTGFMAAGNTVDVYLSFVAVPFEPNAGTSSNSVYATTTVVA